MKLESSNFVEYVDLNIDSSDFKLKFQPQFSDDLQYYSNQKHYCEHSSYKNKVVGKVKKFGKLFFLGLNKVRKTNENKVFKVSDDVDLYFNKPKKSLPIFCNEKDYNRYLNNFKFDVTLKDFNGKNISSVLKKMTLGLNALKKGQVDKSIDIYSNINSLMEIARQNKQALDAFNNTTVDTLFQIYPALGVQESHLNNNHKNGLTLARKKEIVAERLNLLKERNKNLEIMHDKVLFYYHEYFCEVAAQKNFVFNCIDEVMQYYGVSYDSDSYSDSETATTQLKIYNDYFSDPMTLFTMDKSLWRGYVHNVAEKVISNPIENNNNNLFSRSEPVSLEDKVMAELSDNLKHFLQFGVCNENLNNENQPLDGETNVDEETNTSDIANDSVQEETEVVESSSLLVDNNSEPSQPVVISASIEPLSMNELAKPNNVNNLSTYWKNSYEKLSKKEVKQKVQSFEEEAKKFFAGEKISYRTLQNDIRNYHNALKKQLINIDAFLNFARSAEKTKIAFVTIDKNVSNLEETIDYFNQQRIFFEQTMRDLFDLRNKLSKANFKLGILETKL